MRSAKITYRSSCFLPDQPKPSSVSFSFLYLVSDLADRIFSILVFKVSRISTLSSKPASELFLTLTFSNLRFTLSKAARGDDINPLNKPIENRKSFLDFCSFPSFIFSIARNLSSCWYCKKSFSSALNEAETRTIFRS